LQPAIIVLEDVDLVAEHRGFGPGSSPVLFDLLDAMDGAAADADLLFVLTTNRADLLEPALAARPGRVDVAIEIDPPDEEGRRRPAAPDPTGPGLGHLRPTAVHAVGGPLEKRHRSATLSAFSSRSASRLRPSARAACAPAARSVRRSAGRSTSAVRSVAMSR